MSRRRGGWRRLVASLLVVASLSSMPACVSFGRASWNAYDWSGATYPPNPVAIYPYWLGFFVFAIVAAPFDLVSYPLTAIFFPKEEKEISGEFYWFSAIGPSILVGVAGGTILGSIFYPFGMPFMDDRKDWNSEKAPSDDEPLPPPPGGHEPPKK
jgi:hypothetical protein